MLALLAFAALARAQSVLFEGSGYRATVYYDVDSSDVCGTQNGGPFPQNWAVTSGINDGYPFCASPLLSEAKTLAQMGSNRIVAMNANMMANDRAKWCGKEVQIFDASGKQITIDEGPFILYDGCAACASASIIDLSAKAFVAASGGKCGNNPEGLTVKVIDNDLSSSVGGAAAPPTKPQSATTTKAAQTDSPGNVLAAEPAPTTTAVEAPAAAPTAAEASNDGCKYGAWQCAGLNLQVCNHVSAGTEWVTVAPCANVCEISLSGVATCH